MNTGRFRRPQACVLALVFVAALPRVAAAAETAGVIVEQCLPAGAAGRAGVRAGDILVGWSRAPQPPANPEAASGELQSPFDLEDVEVEQAPRGPVTLTGLRDGPPMTALMPAGEWYLTVRPPWTGETLEMYERGRQLQDSGDFYRELRRGASKDEALRRAQASLLHGRFQDPFNCAGFQLQGDWR